MIVGRARAIVVGVPLVWLGLFFAAPFAVVLWISLAQGLDAQPPYAPVLDLSGGFAFNGTLDSYRLLLGDDLYAAAYGNSLRIALTATAICLAVGYPMAYAIASARPAWRMPLLMLVILPFWSSFLVRVYAWMTLLRPTGTINQVLLGLGFIAEPLPLMSNEFAVHLGIVYTYLPFMVLPLYVTLERLDRALLEAAADLGCRPWRAFLWVTLPLSLPGIVAGGLLVFIPAVGEFVIPDLLGGADTPMIGKVLWAEFFSNRDWPAAAALAVATLVVLAGPIALAHHLNSQDDATGGRR